MSWNGSGTFARLHSWVADAAAAIDISSTRMDGDTDDLASNGFGNTLTRDGQGSASANLPMNTFRHTGVGNGVAVTDYAALGQVLSGKINWAVATGTADALAASYSPAITALVDGQYCFVRASAANVTTTPTFAPNGLTAHTITRAGGTALIAGDIPAALAECVLRYNLANTRWELLNPATPGAGSITAAALASNAVTTVKITDANVTYAKIQNEAATTLLGNPTGAPHAPEEITLVAPLAFSGTTLISNRYTPNIQPFTSGSSATYTTPTNGGALPLYLRVRMVAGGGGGGAATTNAGNNGGDTSFSDWTAIHGNGGTAGAGTGGSGGTGGTNGTGTLVNRLTGQSGATNTGANIASGGSSFFGGGGLIVSSASHAAINAVANTGSGGSSGGNSTNAGSGGGAGEFVEFIITAPASSYTYTVGAKGTGGAVGSVAGGDGADGKIIVEAFWQ